MAAASVWHGSLHPGGLVAKNQSQSSTHHTGTIPLIIPMIAPLHATSATNSPGGGPATAASGTTLAPQLMNILPAGWSRNWSTRWKAWYWHCNKDDSTIWESKLTKAISNSMAPLSSHGAPRTPTPTSSANAANLQQEKRPNGALCPLDDVSGPEKRVLEEGEAVDATCVRVAKRARGVEPPLQTVGERRNYLASTVRDGCQRAPKCVRMLYTVTMGAPKAVAGFDSSGRYVIIRDAPAFLELMHKRSWPTFLRQLYDYKISKLRAADIQRDAALFAEIGAGAMIGGQVSDIHVLYHAALNRDKPRLNDIQRQRGPTVEYFVQSHDPGTTSPAWYAPNQALTSTALSSLQLFPAARPMVQQTEKTKKKLTVPTLDGYGSIHNEVREQEGATCVGQVNTQASSATASSPRRSALVVPDPILISTFNDTHGYGSIHNGICEPEGAACAEQVNTQAPSATASSARRSALVVPNSISSTFNGTQKQQEQRTSRNTTSSWNRKVAYDTFADNCDGVLRRSSLYRREGKDSGSDDNSLTSNHQPALGEWWDDDVDTGKQIIKRWAPTTSLISTEPLRCLVLDNDETTGDFQLGSLLFTIYKSLTPGRRPPPVKYFVDEYLIKQHAARPGTVELLRVAQGLKDAGRLDHVVLFTAASNSHGWVDYLADCLTELAGVRRDVITRIISAEDCPRKRESPRIIKDLRLVCSDASNVLIVDDKPQYVRGGSKSERTEAIDAVSSKSSTRSKNGQCIRVCEYTVPSMTIDHLIEDLPCSATNKQVARKALIEDRLRYPRVPEQLKKERNDRELYAVIREVANFFS